MKIRELFQGKVDRIVRNPNDDYTKNETSRSSALKTHPTGSGNDGKSHSHHKIQEHQRYSATKIGVWCSCSMEIERPFSTLLNGSFDTAPLTDEESDWDVPLQTFKDVQTPMLDQLQACTIPVHYVSDDVCDGGEQDCENEDEDEDEDDAKLNELVHSLRTSGDNDTRRGGVFALRPLQDMRTPFPNFKGKDDENSESEIFISDEIEPEKKQAHGTPWACDRTCDAESRKSSDGKRAHEYSKEDSDKTGEQDLTERIEDKKKRRRRRRKGKARLVMCLATQNGVGFELHLSVNSSVRSQRSAQITNTADNFANIDSSSCYSLGRCDSNRRSILVSFPGNFCRRGSRLSTGTARSKMRASIKRRNRRSSIVSPACAESAASVSCNESVASALSEDTDCSWQCGEDNLLDLSIHDHTGVVPEIERRASAGDKSHRRYSHEVMNEPEEGGVNLKKKNRKTGPPIPEISIPFLILGTSANDNPASSRVLSSPLMTALRSRLPFVVSGHNFWLKYSLVSDGSSLRTLLDSISTDAYTIFAIETEEGEIFGSFTSTAWRKDPNYYGRGVSFLWRATTTRKDARSLSSEFDQTYIENIIEVFPWSGRNEYIQLCKSNMIAVGGGGGKAETADCSIIGDGISSSCCTAAPGFGLCIDDELYHGASSPCATFKSPPLSKLHTDGSPFNVLNMEVWALTPCASVAEALKIEAMKRNHN